MFLICATGARLRADQGYEGGVMVSVGPGA